MAGTPETDDRAMASLGARMSHRFRLAWAAEKSRRRMVVAAVLVIAAVSLVVVVSLFASLAGESQSYRDGYSAGGTAYTAYSDSHITPDEACRDVAAEPQGRPAHDNLAQWVQGCVDAFNLAASDN